MLQSCWLIWAPFSQSSVLCLSVLTRDDIRFILNEESDYCEENTSHNEDFRSTILQSFQFQPEQKKKRVVICKSLHSR